MMPFRRYSFLLLLSFIPLFLSSQVRQIGTPLGLTESFLEQDISHTPTLRIPLYNRAKFAAMRQQYPNFVMDGIGSDIEINLQTAGEWSLLPNGDRLWRLKIEVNGTESLTFLYDDFWLPKGAKFYVYSEDESQVLGAFTADNNKPSGRFSTATIYDDGVFLEYREPSAVIGLGRISINKVLQKPSMNARSNGEFGFDASSDCHINSNCAQGQSVRKQKRGVARIRMFLEGPEVTFLGYCTGTLMNNTENTPEEQTPYILTAFHCLVPGFRPLYDRWQFDFGYEAVTCDNPTRAPTPRTIVGCEQVAGKVETDFLLLKISTPIPSSFNPYFCGWNATQNTIPTGSKMISQPCGDIKKVTVDNRESVTIHPSVTNWDTYTSAPYSHFRAEFDEGFSQVGGSGAALIGEDGLIYGQLHGGNTDDATCVVNRLFYGRLAESWDSNRAASRLKDWLSPNNDSLTILEGFDPFESEMASISGVISTPKEEGVGQVTVQFLNADTMIVATTDIAGAFQVALPRTTEYLVRFSKETQVSNGVTTFDLVRIRQAILGVAPFEDVFTPLAADINLSNSVTTFDVVELRKAILGVYETFPAAPSWGFVSPEGTLFNLFTLNNLSPVVNFNVTAIKIGDVNYSADPSK